VFEAADNSFSDLLLLVQRCRTACLELGVVTEFQYAALRIRTI
jgi:hypothetical protein